VTEAEIPMADEKPSMDSSRIQLAAGDDLSRGRCSNTMLVSHSDDFSGTIYVDVHGDLLLDMIL
jgi:hypothetical protein